MKIDSKYVYKNVFHCLYYKEACQPSQIQNIMTNNLKQNFISLLIIPFDVNRIFHTSILAFVHRGTSTTMLNTFCNLKKQQRKKFFNGVIFYIFTYLLYENVLLFSYKRCKKSALYVCLCLKFLLKNQRSSWLKYNKFKPDCVTWPLLRGVRSCYVSGNTFW